MIHNRKPLVLKRKAAPRRTQLGLTMVEAGVVLILLAGLTYFAYNQFSASQRRNQVRENVTAITDLAAAIKQKFGYTNRYGAVTTAILVQSNTIPVELHASTTTAINNFGGAITAAPTTLVSTNDAVRLSWANVPDNQCVDIVVGAENTARRVRVAGVEVKPNNGTLNLGTATTQCLSSAAVTVDFDIGR
jgi:Tfp pilus assembly protein PilE